MQRTASAVWHGTGKDGSGTLDSQSGTLKSHPYSYRTRFQDEEGRSGTNPEELIGAALAGCFTMQLSFMLSAAGHTPEELRTQAIVTMEQHNGANTITRILLKLEGKVPGSSDEEFDRIANEAKAACPVSRVLKADISLEATLTSAEGLPL